MAKLAASTENSEASTPPMAERVRLFDWSRTPLGPLSDWPPLLRSTVSLVLNARIPMCLAWGDSLTSFCNDAYPLLGNEPDALGRPFPEICAEAWPVMGPIVGRARAGEAGGIEDLSLILQRRGYPEHTWWTFSCSPVSDETGHVRGILCVGHETTGEVESRAAVPIQREQLARLFENAPGFMTYLSGPNHVFQLNKPHFRHAAADRELLGRNVREAFPELEGQGVFEILDEVYQSGKALVETGRKMVFANVAGEHDYYFNQVYQPVRDDDGSVIGIFVVGQDVTDVVKAEAALQEREERLRLALDAGRMAVWDVDLVAGVIAASPELNRMFGLPPDAAPSLEEVWTGYFPGELDRMRRIAREARQRGEAFAEAEYRHIRADNGEVRWLLIRSMLFAKDGAIRSGFGVILDVTERKEAEERLKLLALEVDHRANNLLATVQSMVTLTRAEDIPGFRETVLGRIGALAHAHRLLAESRWAAAGLSRVVEEELRPFLVGNQVRVQGRDANLAPAVAQGLAMALHELATNAVKHGALSRRDGRIDVSWTAPDDAGCVRMTWLERGGPPVSPPTRAGFGMNLLRRALAGPVGGSVELEWQAGGVCCRMQMPVL